MLYFQNPTGYYKPRFKGSGRKGFGIMGHGRGYFNGKGTSSSSFKFKGKGFKGKASPDSESWSHRAHNEPGTHSGPKVPQRQRHSLIMYDHSIRKEVGGHPLTPKTPKKFIMVDQKCPSRSGGHHKGGYQTPLDKAPNHVYFEHFKGGTWRKFKRSSWITQNQGQSKLCKIICPQNILSLGF